MLAFGLLQKKLESQESHRYHHIESDNLKLDHDILKGSIRDQAMRDSRAQKRTFLEA